MGGPAYYRMEKVGHVFTLVKGFQDGEQFHFLDFLQDLLIDFVLGIEYQVVYEILYRFAKGQFDEGMFRFAAVVQQAVHIVLIQVNGRIFERKQEYLRMPQRFAFYIGGDGDENKFPTLHLPVYKVIATDLQFTVKQEKNVVVIFVFETEDVVFLHFMIFEPRGLGKGKHP
jgi:hypothetical protein